MKQDENDEQNAQEEQPLPPEPLSRRDFLRRASKEAVKTGVTLVPGGAVARAVLGVGEKADKENDEETNERLKNLPGWMRSLAKWRDNKRREKNDA